MAKHASARAAQPCDLAIRHQVKATIKDILSRDQEYEACAAALQSKTDVAPIHSAIKAIGNPTAQLGSLHKQICRLLIEINEHIKKAPPTPAPAFAGLDQEEDASTPPAGLSDDVADRIDLENGETLRLMYAR